MVVDKIKLTSGNITFYAGENELNHITCDDYGNLNVNYKKIINVLDPINELDVSNKNYVDLHINNFDNPHNVTKDQIGLSYIRNIKSNYDAITDPTNNDDESQAYSIGSRWINNITKQEWILFDSTSGNAIWKNTNTDAYIPINDNSISDTSLWSSNKINTELLTKSDISHTHDINSILGLDTYIQNNTLDTQEVISIINSRKWIPDGIASLDSNSKIPVAQIPNAAFTDIYVVNDVMQMNALYMAKKGDLAKVNNLNNKSVLFVHTGVGWLQLAISDDFLSDVNSVNNKTGYVFLSTADIPETSNLYYTNDRVTQHLDVFLSTQHRQNMNNPHGVTKTQIGLSNVQNIKNNYVATGDPTNIHDSVAGYSVGSRWINNTTNKEFVCVLDTEMNALWTETTQAGGEFNTASNLGNGAGIFSNKIDSDLRFKSILGGSHINIANNTNDITINAENSHSFILTSMRVDAISTNYKSVLYFPWYNSQFANFTNGKLVFETEIFDRNLDIRVLDSTHNTVLGYHDTITMSGVYSFNVANPSDDTRIVIEIKKYSDNGTDPRIYGMLLRFTS